MTLLIRLPNPAKKKISFEFRSCFDGELTISLSFLSQLYLTLSGKMLVLCYLFRCLIFINNHHDRIDSPVEFGRNCHCSRSKRVSTACMCCKLVHLSVKISRPNDPSFGQQTCLGTATGQQGGCSNVDLKCLCSNVAYINVLACCISTKCSSDDQQSTT